MKKYYDFVFLTKEALLECLEQKVNDKTKTIYLSKSAKVLIKDNEFKGIPIKIDSSLNNVYLCVEV